MNEPRSEGKSFLADSSHTQQWIPRRPENTHSKCFHPKSSRSARSNIFTAITINLQQKYKIKYFLNNWKTFFTYTSNIFDTLQHLNNKYGFDHNQSYQYQSLILFQEHETEDNFGRLWDYRIYIKIINTNTS
jgi:hypothetical protein